MSVPRSLAVVGLLVLGVLALPVLAFFLDGEGTENLIIPADLVLMAVVGALVWRLVPAPAGAEVPPIRTALVGAGIGVLAAVVGLVIFFLLLSGFGGA
jgi:hypothetical protein